MKPHQHYGDCPYNGQPNAQAWRRHARAALLAWLGVAVVLYLVLVVVALCVKAIR